MTWPTPQFSKGQINKAGSFLAADSVSDADLAWAEGVLGNWRSCHGYPINTFQATLRTKLKSIDGKAIVAQRLKRTPSIVTKLKRFEGMQLARMQDIGGLRAVVSNLSSVRALVKAYESSRFEHEIVRRNDYIAEPKGDGYRSVHIVYRYKNPGAPAYDGLHVELQIRTRLQHAWATAVETMGTFLGQALKSQQGEQKWLKFFSVAGAAFAHLEKSPLVPGYESLNQADTFARVAEADAELHVLEKLRGFSVAVDAITTERRPGSYHLVILDSQRKQVQIRAFARSALEEATRAYTSAEERARNGESIEVVLVSAGPIESLRRAYPNYFLDTNEFIKRIETVISRDALATANKPQKRTKPSRRR